MKYIIIMPIISNNVNICNQAMYLASSYNQISQANDSSNVKTNVLVISIKYTSNEIINK